MTEAGALAERLAEAAAALAPQTAGFVLTDPEGRILWASPGLAERLARDRLAGRPLAQALRLSRGAARALEEAVRDGAAWEDTVRTAVAGQPRWWTVRGRGQWAAGGGYLGWMAVVEDETGRVVGGFRDPLTGLLNRAALASYLPQAVARAARGQGRVVLALVDLDDFKPVNDEHGHAAGDRVLQAVARRIREAVRETDLVVRLGGDEFVVVLEDAGGDDAIARRWRAVLDRLAEPVEVRPGAAVRVTASLGWTSVPPGPPDLDALLAQADQAMYAAKLDRKIGRPGAVGWARWTPDLPAAAPRWAPSPVPPFGDDAARLLAQSAEALQAAMAAAAGQAPAWGRDDLRGLELAVQRCVERLPDPALAEADWEAGAAGLGARAALEGVPGPALWGAWTRWHHALVEGVLALPWKPDRKALLVQVITQRVDRALAAQEAAYHAVIHRYHQAIESAGEWAGADGLWADRLPAALRRIAGMPGMVAAAWARPGADGRFVAEFATPGFLDRAPMAHVGLLQGLPPRPSEPWVRAWATGRMAARSQLPGRAAGSGGARSCLAAPALDAEGQPVGVLLLYGAEAGMMGTGLVRAFAAAVAGALGKAWQARHRAAPPLASGLRARFRHLLLAGRLAWAVQPVVDLRTGRPAKAEVLARLDDDGAIVPPGRFLPAFGQAEVVRLFVEALRAALAMRQAWAAQGCEVVMGVNLPAQALVQPECPRWVAEALALAACPPDALELELLETTPEGAEALAPALEAVRALGVGVSMDDLGAGYSGLQRLRGIPFRAAKVDWSLVRQAAAKPDETITFLGGLVRLLHALGIAAVFEGLETPDLVEMAAALGADYGQGYAIARPMPPEAWPGWAAGWRAGWAGEAPATDLGRRALAWREAQGDAR
ncbi:MAG: EAL domain-containing protein [Firmicutes bacterium]|nr:EAL domain-containing protein [Bacillota bacterium]